MIGPPGAGKTMLARRLPGLLPPLSPAESLEVSAVHSVAGLLRGVPSLSRVRPFRAPHHTVSEVGLVGGGDVPRPGEVSLAHHGVLFLDELPEFRRAALESLRQPLEDGTVTVSRAQGRATFPARPLLVGAMNPCMCGYHGDPAGRCGCPPDRVRLYRSRLSGPLLDRIDVHVRLPPVSVQAMQREARGESSRLVRERVQIAREIQHGRQRAGEVRAALNGVLSGRELERVARLGPAAERILTGAAERLGLSARAYGKVLRVARTIADLAGNAEVEAPHVAEAVGLRVLDRRATDQGVAAA
jgi:magnesium chelatase family protein